MRKIRICYEFILMIVMIIVSGTPLQSKYNSQTGVLFFALAVFYRFIFNKTKINRKILIWIISLGTLLMMTMIINRDSDITHYIGELCVIMGTALVVSAIPYKRFCRLFINFIAAVSVYSVIITLISNIVPSFPGTLPLIKIGSLQWRHIGYFYYYWSWHQWMSFIRNSACFREPGVFGVYAVLALNMLMLSAEQFSRSDRRKAICIIMGIISSVSTTAIFGLFLCFIFYLFQTKKLTTRKVVYLGGALIVGFLIVYNLGERLFGKLISSSSSHNSFTERLNGIYGGINKFLKNPFFGSGYSNYYIGSTGTSANSFIDILGKYGIFFGLIIIIGLICFIMHSSRRLTSRILTGLIFLVLLGTQNLILYPIFLALNIYGYSNKRILKRNISYV